MIKELLDKLKESVFSILPISMIVLVLGLILKINTATILSFLICIVFLIVGLALFSKGADSAMFTMGETMSSALVKTKKTWLVLLSGLLIGFVITMAEPDLQILANQVTSINKWLLIAVIAIGVGILFMMAILRIIFRFKVRTVLMIGLMVVFVLSFFVPKGFIAIAFDGGATTTGSLSVPLMLAFGFGMASMRGGNSSDSDTFGMLALGSIGPVITVLIMGLFIPADSLEISATSAKVIETMSDGWHHIGMAIVENLKDVLIILLPILAIFFIFQFTIMHLPKQKIGKILIGVLYAYVGIVLFLTGTSVGLMPLGSQIGMSLANTSYSWVLIPVGAVFGFCIVIAEPAVMVLNKNVELITFGAIKKRNMLIALAVGVAIASALAIVRVLYNVDYIWLILPMYVLAIVMSFFTKDIFTAVAFDSGGVSSGTMAVSLILPMVSGVCRAVGTDLFAGAFGAISLISAMPILVVEIMGVFYTVASKRHVKRMDKVNKAMNKASDSDNDVVSFRY